MPRDPINIEELLETMGSQEHPGDLEHRYELRRRLLCSRFFEDACPKSARWDRLMSYTAPLVTGSMMVGVFALMAVYAPIEPDVGPQTDSPPNTTQISSVPTTATEVTPIRAEDFLSDPLKPTVSLAEFETKDQLRSRYVPLGSVSYVRIR